jgi:hypothetical protein
MTFAFHTRWLARAAIAAAAAIAALPAAQAATVTVTGERFDLVYDDSLVGLFGTPTLSGTSLFFTPAAFKTQTLNGTGLDEASALLNFRVLPHANWTLDGVDLLERGSYLLRGADSFVSASGLLRVFGVADPASEQVAALQATAPFGLANGVAQAWTATAALAFGGAPLDGSLGYHVSFSNLLESYTESAATGPRRAYIDTGFAMFNFAVSPVPEPTAPLMMLAGVAVAGLVGRRRRG